MPLAYQAPQLDSAPPIHPTPAADGCLRGLNATQSCHALRPPSLNPDGNSKQPVCGGPLSTVPSKLCAVVGGQGTAQHLTNSRSSSCSSWLSRSISAQSLICGPIQGVLLQAGCEACYDPEPGRPCAQHPAEGRRADRDPWSKIHNCHDSRKWWSQHTCEARRTAEHVMDVTEARHMCETSTAAEQVEATLHVWKSRCRAHGALCIDGAQPAGWRPVVSLQ